MVRGDGCVDPPVVVVVESGKGRGEVNCVYEKEENVSRVVVMITFFLYFCSCAFCFFFLGGGFTHVLCQKKPFFCRPK